jgi:hypothetical protein
MPGVSRSSIPARQGFWRSFCARRTLILNEKHPEDAYTLRGVMRDTPAPCMNAMPTSFGWRWCRPARGRGGG